MRIPLAKRLTITLCNIFFPPLAVALLTGPTSRDTLLNACLFLLAVIPSHIHGFYISAVYFTRKRRVRKGVWPGKPYKRGVWSEKVLTGGVGWEEAEGLKRRGDGDGEGEGSDFDNERRRSRREGDRGERRVSRQASRSKSRRNSRHASRVQSRVQEPVETRTEMQETGQITIANDGTRNARTSRWVEGL